MNQNDKKDPRKKELNQNPFNNTLLIWMMFIFGAIFLGQIFGNSLKQELTITNQELTKKIDEGVIREVLIIGDLEVHGTMYDLSLIHI
mgnify:CR=1 FL=1